MYLRRFQPAFYGQLYITVAYSNLNVKVRRLRRAVTGKSGATHQGDKELIDPAHSNLTVIEPMQSGIPGAALWR
jgi:transketolase C-terminal domain/subunit